MAQNKFTESQRERLKLNYISFFGLFYRKCDRTVNYVVLSKNRFLKKEKLLNIKWKNEKQQNNTKCNEKDIKM